MKDLPNFERSARRELVRPALVMAGACLVYLAIVTCVGRFPVTDEVFFKSAGRQWAAGRGFGAPELEGAVGSFSPQVSEVFFLHPPMYPFLFGVWTRVLGFGARQCMAFDASIHVLLTSLVFALGWRVLASVGRARRWLAMGVAVAILPLGTVARPDELAMCFGTISWLLLLAADVGVVHLVLGGVALGLCVGTSTGAASAAGFVALTLLVRAGNALWGPLARSFRRCLLFAAGTIVGVAVSVGPLLAAHPGAVNQYLTHARLLVSRITIWNAWAEARPHGLKYFSFLFGTLLSGVLAAALAGTRKAWRVWADYGLGAFLYLLFLGACLALRYTYTWFMGPWILLAAVHMVFSLATTPGKQWRALFPAGLLAIGYLSFAAYFVKETLVVGTLPASQRIDAASARLRKVIPEGATVLTKELWWFIAERNKTYEPMFSHPPEASIEYVALSANGSGVPGKPAPLDPSAWSPAFTGRMVEVDDNLPQRATHFLGLRITNSSYGYGAAVYRMTPRRP